MNEGSWFWFCVMIHCRTAPGSRGVGKDRGHRDEGLIIYWLFLPPGCSGSIAENEVRCGDPAFCVVLLKLAMQVFPAAQTKFPQISLEGTVPGGFEFCHRVRYPGLQPYSVEVPKPKASPARANLFQDSPPTSWGTGYRTRGGRASTRWDQFGMAKQASWTSAWCAPWGAVWDADPESTTEKIYSASLSRG